MSTATVTEPRADARQHLQRIRQSPYHVILLNDDDHTYEYVIEMLQALFGASHEHAYQMAVKVDTEDSMIADTTTKERAELKRDQIHAYGRDWRVRACRGSMSAVIEPAN